MATPSGGGSTLAALAARRAALQKSRARLNLSSGGVGAPSAPQASLQPANPVPPLQPQTTPAKQAPAPVTNPGQPVRDPKMLEQAQQFLDQVRTQGRAVAPQGPSIEYAPPSMPLPLSEQVQRAGAAAMSPEMQAYRVFGRPPGGREMAIFNAVRNLEQQLGRPPTRNELLMHVTRPGGLSSGPEPTVG